MLMFNSSQFPAPERLGSNPEAAQMKGTSASHHTIIVKRTYAAPPKRVFAAWTDPEALVKWYLPGDSTWVSRIERHDLRVGGL
jgi:uncharacterized protein YndB with AHSA1/START domain